MKDSLFIGLILGMVAGAVLATYNQDVSREVTNVVDKGKQAVKKQIDKVKN